MHYFWKRDGWILFQMDLREFDLSEERLKEIGGKLEDFCEMQIRENRNIVLITVNRIILYPWMSHCSRYHKVL